jgi:uncharacterized lipoprotein YmbA
MSDPALEIRTAKEAAIVVGPVVIPSALDRPEIVIRGSDNTLTWSEFHRWAGRLDEEIASVLAQDLAELLRREQIVPFFREDVLQPNLRVLIGIDRFDGRLQNQVELVAVWSIRAAATSETFVVKQSTIRENVLNPDYSGYTAAQSRALFALAQEIAEAIARLQ